MALGQKITLKTKLFFDSLFGAFWLDLDAKGDPKYLNFFVFNDFLASSISCVDFVALGGGFWLSRRDPDFPKTLQKQMVLKGFVILSFFERFLLVLLYLNI